MSEIDRDTPAPSSALVSVIMPISAGDSLARLEQAVKSIQAQTYDHFEFLIVLDGPVNRELQAFLDRATLHDDRIQVLPMPNSRGLARARNHAIDRAVGDYIALLNADDIALPDRFEKQLTFLIDCGADLAGSHYRLIDADGNVIGDQKVPTDQEGIRSSFCVFNPIANSTVFARAAVLKEDRFVESLRWVEDYELWIRLARRGRVLRNQDTFLALVRDTGHRAGWNHFQREVRCKLHALPLFAVHLAPLMIVLSVVSAIPKLFPAPLYRRWSGIRGR